MTQLDVARAVGMPQPSIARIEREAVLPRMATVLAILEATGHELLVEPRQEVRPQIRRAVRERLLRSVPRRTRDALGRSGSTAVLRALRREAVRFVLIGDLAEVVWGAPRTAGPELEICPDSPPHAGERLAEVLRHNRDLRDATDAGRLRLTSVTAAGDGYEVLLRNASRLIVDTSLLVHVASLEDLMRVRRARREDAEIEILAAVELELRAGGAG